MIKASPQLNLRIHTACAGGKMSALENPLNTSNSCSCVKFSSNLGNNSRINALHVSNGSLECQLYIYNEFSTRYKR